MILDCSEVVPDRLWIGAFVHPEDVRLLRRMGVTTVVSLQSDKDTGASGKPAKKLIEAYNKAEIELRRVATLDFDQEALAGNLEQSVAELEAALAPKWAKVYLHCTAGINRSPTVAAAFLIRTRKFSAHEAHEFVMARRHCNPYLTLLEKYEAFVKNEKK